jgi:hypothetical protein
MGHGSPDADFVLAVNSIEEYGNHYRSAIAPWPHLLLEQDICVPGGHLSEAGPSLADCRAYDYSTGGLSIEAAGGQMKILDLTVKTLPQKAVCFMP